MHDLLISYIEKRLSIKLSEVETALIRDNIIHKKIRKNQYLLQEGDICRFAGFVAKGALKQYMIDESGKENVLGLFIENWWAGDRESFVNGSPSHYAIQAIEDTEMLVITMEIYNEKLADQVFMADLMHSLTERQALSLLKRVHAVKTMTAEQRLADLEETYPEFLQRFPQHTIASYLGMTKETLSRIRAAQFRK